MKLITYAQNKHDLYLCRELDITSVILGHRDFSRFGKLSEAEFFALAREAKELELDPIFEWDILMVQNDFKELSTRFKNYDLSAFSSIRLQDPGAINYVYENFKNLKIELNLEIGNHNFEAVSTWVSLIKDRLSKVILSIELPHAKLQEFISKLDVPAEILGLGRILIFYTPRNLLSNLLPEDDAKKSVEVNNRFLEATGESEESPHKGFPLVENKHGTFMFHIKEHYLLDHLKELEEMKVDYLRIDLRFGKDINLLRDISEILYKGADPKAFKEKYPSDVIRGFFHANKTDVLFKRLKNTKITRHDENYVGEVVDALKGEYLGIILKNKKIKLAVGDNLKLITPTGLELHAPVVFLKNSDLEPVSLVTDENLIFINYVRNAWVKTQIYLEKK